MKLYVIKYSGSYEGTMSVVRAENEAQAMQIDREHGICGEFVSIAELIAEGPAEVVEYELWG